jgi:SPP1 family predicted phage head-tail adaptor
VTRAYTTFTTIWACVRARGGTLVWRADQQDAMVTHEIVFRALDGITGAMRLRDGERLFRILAVEFLNEKQTMQRALCEEAGP